MGILIIQLPNTKNELFGHKQLLLSQILGFLQLNLIRS